MKRIGLKWFMGLVFFGVFASAGWGDGEAGRTQTLSPYFFVENRGEAVEQLPLKKTDVSVQIDGVIADVVIRQSYANTGKIPVNARYVFPASTRAAVEGMTMRIGKSLIRATIKEKEAAQKTFDDAKKNGKSVSLLSQQRPNVFTMDVANIMPGDRVEVELHYTELLIPTDGVYEFVYPAVVGPRYSSRPREGASGGDAWVETPYLKDGDAVKPAYTISARLSTGMPLHDVTCPSHETVVRFDTPAMADVMLKNGSGYGGDRDYILRYRLSDDKIQSGLMLYSGIRGNYFLLTVQPPRRVAVDDIPPREYVFVVDVSGSMHGFPLDVSKTLLKNLIGSLRPSDTFNVVLFAGASRVMAPSSIPATSSNIEAALRTIDEEGGGGGTELPAAMDTAFGIPKNPAVSRSMIVVTDGYIDAEKEVFEKIRSHLSGTNVFAFGIGSSVNRYLIEGIAHAGQGEPFVVSDPSEAPSAAKRFCDYVREPLLKDIRLDVEGFEAYDLEPSAIPDMFSRRPIVVVGRWKGEAKGTLRVTGNSAQGPYAQTFRVADAKPVDENRPIRSLWARTRITRLSQDVAGPDGSVYKDEITKLGLEYSLLTQFTSFVAVHETVRNPGGEGKDVKQPLPLPKGVSPLAVGGDYSSVPEPGLGLMLLLMAGVAIRSMKGRAAGIRK